MLKSLFIMALAFTGILSSTTHAEMPPLNHSTKPTAVVFYADWCGSCKILDPKMMQAVEQLEEKDALKIITFDLTDETTKAKSADLAGEHGLTDLYNEFAPKTGFVILVKDGKPSVKITKKDSVEDIKTKLEEFISLNS